MAHPLARDLVTVLLLGHPDPGYGDRIRLEGRPGTWADGFTVVSAPTDDGLGPLLAAIRPQVIVTFGEVSRFPQLLAAPLEQRRRWLHREDVDTPPAELARDVLACFVDVATRDRFPRRPLVSVFTPTHNQPAYVSRLYASLCAQTYANWEWVVYDDSTTEDVWRLLCALREQDGRVQAFRSQAPCGVIGEVKRRACGLARGAILVEVDHDDELVDAGLAHVVDGFNAFPDAGFVYSDNAAVRPDGSCVTYGGADGFAFGFGSYRDEWHEGRVYQVTNAPSINPKTVRHIVGMPDHVRAWRREAYHEAGGHRSEVHVADDYELLLRTFLTTRMVHVQRFAYIQHHHEGGSNTHKVRNREIQRLVACFADRYEAQIHQRFLELGVPDFLHRDGRPDWSVPNPPHVLAANYVLGPVAAATSGTP